MSRLERITLKPDKRDGKPCIRGLGITVYEVLDWGLERRKPQSWRIFQTLNRKASRQY